MFEYGLRDLFKDGFEILHMRFYQLGKLMEVSDGIYLFFISISLFSEKMYR